MVCGGIIYSYTSDVSYKELEWSQNRIIVLVMFRISVLKQTFPLKKLDQNHILLMYLSIIIIFYTPVGRLILVIFGRERARRLGLLINPPSRESA